MPVGGWVQSTVGSHVESLVLKKKLIKHVTHLKVEVTLLKEQLLQLPGHVLQVLSELL